MTMRRFRCAALAAVAVISIASAASAADLPAKAPMYTKAPMVAPAFSWTGFYIGVNGGYGWNDPTVTYTPNDPGAALGCGVGCIPPASFNMSGGLAGGQIGYNWQFSPKWLVGVEADFDWSRINGSASSNFNLNSYGPGTFTASETVKSFGTLRGRLGFIPTDSLLVFGTGGLAYGHVNTSAVMPGPAVGIGANGAGGFSYVCGTATGQANCFNGASSQTMVGWTIGAGGEYRITNNFTLKAEYLYANLGRTSINTVATTTFGGVGSPASYNANFGTVSFNVVRLGLNYKFN
jgi:outer membrane immunogenic protein